MPITQVNSSTFLADSVLLIRDILLTNITDPITATRPTGEKFVVTAYPMRAVTYPLITVVDRGITEFRKGGMNSNVGINRLGIELRIWARNVKERDELAQQVLDYLRGQQQTSSTTRLMHDYRIDGLANVDEPGFAGVKSKIISISFLEILS